MVIKLAVVVYAGDTKADEIREMGEMVTVAAKKTTGASSCRDVSTKA